MNENDARVIRTRSALRKTLTSLVIEEGFDSLTVRQIAECANVGYKTFYRHYDSKEDLLKAIQKQYIAKLTAVFEPPISMQIAEENVRRILEVAAEESDTLRMLFHTPADYALLNALVAEAEKAEQLPLWEQKPSELPPQLLAYQFTCGPLQLVRWWIENNQPYSQTEMAHYIKRLVIEPVWHNASRPLIFSDKPLANP